jgi:TonB family protein
MSDHKDDIEKYLDGTLSNAERHQLEKKALSDPFLAEALEGIEMLTNEQLSHDLAVIYKRIHTQKRNAFYWPLRIAAGILVIVSITVVTIKLTENNTNNRLALQKQNSASKNLAPPDKMPAPSYSEKSAPKVELQTPTPENQQRLRNQPSISEKPQMSQAEGPESNTDARSPASAVADQTVKESETTNEILRDEIVEQENESLKGQETEDKKTALAPSKNDIATAPPSAPRSLAFKKTETANTKTETASGAGAAQDDAQPLMIESEPSPTGGMSLFTKYVEDNLRYPQRALDRNVQGDVIIEFQINANGNYQNFKVIKSLGFGCDEEAIRLIKQGPKWIPTIQDGKVIDSEPRVTIPFRIKKTGNE